MERILPDHYTKTLVGSVVDQAVFTQLVQIHLPNLSAHMSKMYMDLAVFSVPWFVCLYLNTVSFPLAIKFLDCFFLDGPKFLFWLSISILKVNEKKLIERGRDDDIFVRILKEYFRRLDNKVIPGEEVESDDPADLCGRLQFNHLLNVVYGTMAPLITNEAIESLRMKHRLKVVHQMEDTNRKSQIRTLCEQVSLSMNEVGVVYDQVRRLEFTHGEEDENPKGQAATASRLEVQEEGSMREILSSLGGWGMVRHLPKGPTKQSLQKTISLSDFRKVFAIVSPWRSGASNMDRQSVTSFRNRHSSVNSSESARTRFEDFHLPLIDRIFFYSGFQYHYVQKQKMFGKEGSGARSSSEPGKLQNDIGFNVDLTAMVHVLDTIMKQPLQSRLRLLFDLHDMDGDGYLSKEELKSVMDSLLEMFEKARQVSSTTQGPEAKPRQTENEELYLAAVSSFLASALKLGKETSGGATGSIRRSGSTSFSQNNLGQTHMRGQLSQKAARGMEMAVEEEEESGDMSSFSPSATDADRVDSFRPREEDSFKLSFNEFLLAVLSQSVFVEYFERIWTVQSLASGEVVLSRVSS